MISEFRHSDLMKIFPSLKPRTIISWSERELLEPDIQDAAGRGSSRCYSYKNLIEIAIIGEFLSYGMPFSFVRKVVRSRQFRQAMNEQRWDTVFCITHVVDSGMKLIESENSIFEHFSIHPVVEFSDKGGRNLLGSLQSGKESASNLTKSAIVVNIHTLDKIVKRRVGQLRI